MERGTHVREPHDGFTHCYRNEISIELNKSYHLNIDTNHHQYQITIHLKMKKIRSYCLYMNLHERRAVLSACIDANPNTVFTSLTEGREGAQEVGTRNAPRFARSSRTASIASSFICT